MNMTCTCGSERVVKNGGGRVKCLDCGKTSNIHGKPIRQLVGALPPLTPTRMPKFEGPIIGFGRPRKADPSRVHLMIPDTQVRKGVPLDHIDWIGQYIVDRKPDVLIHIGDHYDMPSLSMHDQAGSMSREGARYADDIEAGNDAMERLVKPMRKAKLKPEMHFMLGNHEQRIERAINADPRYAGVIGYQDFNAKALGFKVHDFLRVVDIDGVWYSHYFAQPLSGRPYGGTVDNRMNKIAHSFTQGHEQMFRYSTRYLANGQEQHGLVAGACYLHDEEYKGLQGNYHWRGLIVKHEVRNGAYDIMRVSLDFLCRKYEGASLATFLHKKYPKMRLSQAE